MPTIEPLRAVGHAARVNVDFPGAARPRDADAATRHVGEEAVEARSRRRGYGRAGGLQLGEPLLLDDRQRDAVKRASLVVRASFASGA